VADSIISPGTIAAYAATRYRVFRKEPFELKIGHASSPLQHLYEEYDCSSAAFITAWNAYSVAATDADNEAAQARLEGRLTAGSIPFISGIGEDAAGEWPGEPSVLALGIDLDAAKTIGIEFRQNAIVWVGEDAVPQLVMLR
jgi:hypothetical protein